MQQQTKKIRNNINTLKPVAIRTEKVDAPAPSKPSEVSAHKEVATTEVKKPAAPETIRPQADQKGAYIIVASLANAQDADRELKAFEKQGYKNVRVLESDGRYRIALHYYKNPNEAYRKVVELRKDEQFKSAWVFTKR